MEMMILASTQYLDGASISKICIILGVCRNPQLKDDLFRFAILGFALTEAIALFALMIAFLILFV